MSTATAASEIAPPPHPRDELKSLALEADQFYASDDWKNADAPTRQKYLDRSAEVFDEAFKSAESSLDEAEADSFYNSTTAFLQGKMAEHNKRVTGADAVGVLGQSFGVAQGMAQQTIGSGVMRAGGTKESPAVEVQPLDWSDEVKRRDEAMKQIPELRKSRDEPAEIESLYSKMGRPTKVLADRTRSLVEEKRKLYLEKKAAFEKATGLSPSRTDDLLAEHDMLDGLKAGQAFKGPYSGEVYVSPDLALMQDEYDKAVDATDATPEKKAKAKAHRLKVRDQLAGKIEFSLAAVDPEWEKWSAGMAGEMKDASVGEKVERFIKWRKASGAKMSAIDRAVDQNAASFVKQFFGLIGGITNIGMMKEAAATAGEIEQANATVRDAIGGAGATGFAVDLFGGLAPTIAFSPLARLATTNLGAMRLMFTVGAAGSYGGKYADASAAYKEQGFSDRDAHMKAQLPALVSAATTYILANMMPRGVESIARIGRAKDALKTATRKWGGELFADIKDETFEEIWQGISDEITAKFTYDPSKDMKTAVSNVVYGGIMGAVGGGVVGAVSRYANKVKPILETAEQMRKAGYPLAAAETEKTAEIEATKQYWADVAKAQKRAVERAQSDAGLVSAEGAKDAKSDLYNAFGNVQRKAGGFLGLPDAGNPEGTPKAAGDANYKPEPAKESEPKNEKAQSVPSVQKADESVRLPQAEVAPAAPSPEPVTPAAASHAQTAKEWESANKRKLPQNRAPIPESLSLPVGTVVQAKNYGENEGDIVITGPLRVNTSGIIEYPADFTGSGRMASVEANEITEIKPAAAKPVELTHKQASAMVDKIQQGEAFQKAEETVRSIVGGKAQTKGVAAAAGGEYVAAAGDMYYAHDGGFTFIDAEHVLKFDKDGNLLRDQSEIPDRQAQAVKAKENEIARLRESITEVESRPVKTTRMVRDDISGEMVEEPLAQATIDRANENKKQFLSKARARLAELTGQPASAPTQPAAAPAAEQPVPQKSFRQLMDEQDAKDRAMLEKAEKEGKIGEIAGYTPAVQLPDGRVVESKSNKEGHGELAALFPDQKVIRGFVNNDTKKFMSAMEVARERMKPASAPIEQAIADANWRGTVREVPAPRSMGGEGVKLYIPVDASGKDVSVGGQTILGKTPAEAIELAQKNAKPAPAPKDSTERIQEAAYRDASGKIYKTGAFHDSSKLPKKFQADNENARGVEPGWLTSSGRFVGREEGFAIAAASKQVKDSYKAEWPNVLGHFNVKPETLGAQPTPAPVAGAKTRLDLMLDGVERTGKELTIEVTDANRDNLTKIIETAEKRGLRASTDGRFVLIRPAAAPPATPQAEGGIFGYAWADIRSKQQGGKLAALIRGNAPKATESDFAVLEKHGMDWLYDNKKGSIIDRLGLPVDKPSKKAAVKPKPPAQSFTEKVRAKIVPGAKVSVQLVRGAKLAHPAVVGDVFMDSNGKPESVSVTFDGGGNIKKGRTQTVPFGNVSLRPGVESRMLTNEQFEGMTKEEAQKTRAAAKEFKKLVIEYPELGFYSGHLEAVAAGPQGEAAIKKARADAYVKAMTALGVHPDKADARDAVTQASLVEKLRELTKKPGMERKQYADFQEAKEEGDGEIKAGDLKYGETINIGGEEMRVTDIDKDGVVTLQDGEKFGTQEVHPDESLMIKGETPEPVAPKLRPSDGKGTGELLQGDAAPFNLVAETAADIAKREAREAAEQVAKEAKDAAEAKAKQDKEQGNLFDDDPFTIADTAPTTSLPVESVQRAVRVVAGRLAGAMPHEVIADGSQYPQRVKDAFRKKYGASGDLNRIRGVVVGGRIYINAAAIENAREAIETFMHEAAGHGGVDALLKAFGEKATTQLDAMLKRLFPDDYAAVQRSYEPHEQVSETLARIMQRVGPEMSAQARTRWQRVMDWLRNALNDLGVKRWSTNDVMALLRRGVDAVRKSAVAKKSTNVSALVGNELIYAAREAGVVLTPEQTMRVINRDPAVTADVQARVSDARGEGAKMSVDNERSAPFYSALTKTVQALPQETMTVQQARAAIEKGAKKDEIAMSGILTDPLSPLAGKQPGDKVTKAELTGYALERQATVQDVVLGGGEAEMAAKAKESAWQTFRREQAFANELSGRVTNGAIARGYTQLEAANLTSKLDDGRVTVEELPKELRADASGYLAQLEKFLQAKFELENVQDAPGSPTHFSQYQLPGADEGSYREMFVTWPKEKVAKSPLDVMTMPEMRKWYEAQVGYDPVKDDPSLTEDVLRQQIRDYIGEDGGRSPANVRLLGPQWRDGHPQYSDIANPIVRIRRNIRTDADGKRTYFIEEMQGPGKGEQEKMPPELRKRIYEIGMKRALRDAVDEGADAIAWTTGEQQAERYDLSKQVDEVSVSRGGALGKWEVWATKDGRQVVSKTVETLQEVDGLIGKDLAEKVSDMKAGDFQRRFSGLDLKVGGEGLKHTYDVRLPNLKFIQDLEKKFGVKVGTAEIRGGEKYILIEEPSGVGNTFVLRNKDTGKYLADSKQETWALRPEDGELMSESVARKLANRFAQVSAPETVHSLPIPDALKTQQRGGNVLFSLKDENPEATSPGDPSGALPGGDPAWNWDRTIDPWAKRVIHGGRFIWEGTADVMRRAGFTKLADAVETQYDVMQREFGRAWKPLHDALESMSRKEQNVAKDEWSQYFRHKESGRADEAAATYDAASTGGKAIIDGWKAVAEATGLHMRKVGVEVRDGDTWRPIGLLGQGFFPRKISRDVMKVISDPVNNPVEWARLVADLIANGNIAEASEAEPYLRKNVYHDESKYDHFANIEKARNVKLPESWLDYSFNDVAPWYVTHYARRIGQIEAYGQAHKDGGDLFDKELATVPTTKNYEFTREYLESAKETAYWTRPNTTGSRVLRNMQTVATAQFLSSPYSALRNVVSGIIQTVVQYGPLRTMQAAFTAMTSSAARMDAHDRGIIRRDIMHMMMEGRDDLAVSKALMTVTSAGLTVTGFNYAETINRTASMLAAQNFARWAAREISNDPDGAGALQSKAFLVRHGIDPDEFAKENGDGPLTDKFVRNSVRQGQGGYNMDQIPLWQTKPAAAFLTQFGRWGAMMARFVVKHAINPAVFGTKVKLSDGTTATVRTMRPLLYALASAIGGGELLWWLREKLTGRGRNDDSLEKIGKDIKAGKLGSLLSRVFNDITMAGTLGIIGDYANSFVEFTARGRYKDPFNPPGIQWAKGLFESAVMLKQQGKLSFDDMRDLMEKQFPGVKFTKAAVEHLTGDKSRAAMNAKSAAYSAGIRMAKEQGLPVIAPFNMAIPVRTPNTPFYRDLTDALMIGDAAKARTLWREHLKSTPREERNRLLTGMKTSISQHQPISVGGIEGKSKTLAFFRWAKKSVPKEDYERFKAMHKTYWKTAEKAGLISENPYE